MSLGPRWDEDWEVSASAPTIVSINATAAISEAIRAVGRVEVRRTVEVVFMIISIGSNRDFVQITCCG